MTTRKKKLRLCSICGNPEKKYVFGYSNLTPYSEICAECLNRESVLQEQIERLNAALNRLQGNEDKEDL